jgi:aspartate 1-decarboxylase
MMRRLVRAAIRNATVTSGDALHARIDAVLLRTANILPLEEVEIVNHTTGDRVTTFVEEGAGGEVHTPRMRAGDVVTVIAYGMMHDGQTLNHKATLVTVDATNVALAVQLWSAAAEPPLS